MEFQRDVFIVMVEEKLLNMCYLNVEAIQKHEKIIGRNLRMSVQ